MPASAGCRVTTLAAVRRIARLLAPKKFGIRGIYSLYA